MIKLKFPNFIKIERNGILNINFDDIKSNYISVEKKEYFFNNLSNDGNKGGNSLILKLFSKEDLTDKTSFDQASPIAILKLMKFPFLIKRFKGRDNNIYYDSHKRFLNEIQALKACSLLKNENVINIYDYGECVIDNQFYLFYTMEVADYDLKSYIEANHDKLEFDNKVQLCLELLDGINQLDRAIFFHRDIKPDNIFFVGNVWKMGDLGLVDGKDLNYRIKEEGKFIGPRGWVSPEVMNKYLSENKGFKYFYDCKIDHQSDIFQLGKVFWYIFQYNAPIGNIIDQDFNKENEKVFAILNKMLQHGKERRFKNVSEIIPLFQEINQDCIIK